MRGETTCQHVEKRALIIGQGQYLCRVDICLWSDTRHELPNDAVHGAR